MQGASVTECDGYIMQAVAMTTGHIHPEKVDFALWNFKKHQQQKWSSVRHKTIKPRKGMLNERMQGCFNIYEVDLMFKKVISLMDQRGDLYGERRSCKYYITTEAESTVLKVQ